MSKTAKVNNKGKGKTKTVKLDKKTVSKDTLHSDDLLVVIDSHLKKFPLVSHHVNSFNRMCSTGIKQIITKIFSIEGSIEPERDDKSINREYKNISFTIKFTDVEMKKPKYNKYKSGTEEELYPYTARNINNSTYTSEVYVDAHIKAKAIKIVDNKEVEEVKEAIINDFIIASIPIMVGSNLCNMHGTPKNVLYKMKMDPDGTNGYFVVKGKDWAIDNYESVIFNQFRVFNNRFKNEATRGEFLSKPGDSYENSYETIIRLLNNDMITIQISIAQLKAQGVSLQIPFYLIFRLLGITTDEEIRDFIVYGNDSVNNTIKQLVYNAFIAKDTNAKKLWTNSLNKRTQNEAIMEIAEKLPDSYGKYLNDPSIDKEKLVHTRLLKVMDYQLLPHVGTTPEFRRSKAKFLGYLINTLLRTHLGLIPPNDRDSYKNKRIHPAGEGYSKILKTFFNYSAVQILKRGFIQAFKNQAFHKVDFNKVFQTNVKQNQLEKSLIQSITTGSKDITSGSRRLANRLSSQMIHWKNDLNVLSTLRTISTSNTSVQKGTARAFEMRAVHPSSTGYICPSQSPDTGEKVGLQKQMAITATISLAGNSVILMNKLLESKDVIPEKECPNKRIYEEELFRVFVNGIWVGCTKYTHKLAAKYRILRRKQEINVFTTIYWDNITNHLYFYTDAGRFIRPLLIVHHEYKYDKKGNPISVSQDIKLTKKHIQLLLEGTIDMDYLIKENIVEYISPEEQENCMLSQNYEFLKQNKHNLLRIYTHCEIPQSIPGLPALTSARANHNQGPRITFQTNQSKQTNGVFAGDWPYVFHKNSVVSHNYNQPLVETIANKYTQPNGENCIVAIAIYEGFNQEDSNIINGASRDLGLFDCSYYTFETTDLEKDERFGIPNAAETKSSKAIYANYEKLDANGIVRPGTIVNKNDVIISKYLILKNNDPKYKYADKSIVWKYDEAAEVVEVAPDGLMVSEDGKKFIKIKFRSYRPVIIGDKFSTRSGQKMVCAKIYSEADMPFTSQGIKPDLMMNPFAFPKRMTMGQPNEQAESKLNAYKGVTSDGTIFKATNIDAIRKGLKEIGYNEFGNEVLYNGRTGDKINTAMFIGPCCVQRLQKFVNDTIYAIDDARTCPITHQPTDGKAASGGLKIGEMEKDTINAAGCPRFLRQKFYSHSDKSNIYVCRTCGYNAIVNIDSKIIYCKMCKDNADVVRVRSSWVSNNVFHILHAMGVDTKLFIKKPFEI